MRDWCTIPLQCPDLARFFQRIGHKHCSSQLAVLRCRRGGEGEGGMRPMEHFLSATVTVVIAVCRRRAFLLMRTRRPPRLLFPFSSRPGLSHPQIAVSSSSKVCQTWSLPRTVKLGVFGQPWVIAFLDLAHRFTKVSRAWSIVGLIRG